MATRAPRPCRALGCAEVQDGAWCAEHEPKRVEYRGHASDRGYDARWQKARLVYLNANPWCVVCHDPANVVDHIIPHRGNRRVFWDKTNWQALCQKCHNIKTGKGL